MMVRLKTAIFWIVVVGTFAYGVGWHVSRSDISVNLAGFKPSLSITEKRGPENLTDVNFGLFWDVWDLLEKQYIDKKAINHQKMLDGAISGMVSSLGDPYTTFLPSQQNKTTKEELEGSFEGVGMQLGFRDKRLIVVAPIKDSPADKAGIKPGDFIIKIDGKETTGNTIPDAVAKIRGPRGTAVVLTIVRQDETKPIDYTLVRDKIQIKSVESYFQNNIAYVKLTRFGDTTNDEWKEVVAEIIAKKPRGIVLDLRNNPGGYFESAIIIASDFFTDGAVVHKEHASGQRETFNVKKPGRLLSIPVVIIINKGSASASEIVAGAIQDRSRGILIGEQSFGKGSVQEVRDLPQGAGIHITTEKWLLPSGKWINGTGLTPDIVVPLGDKENEDPQLGRASQEIDKVK